MTDVHLQCHATDLTGTVHKVVTHMQARTTHTPGPNTYMNWHKFKARQQVQKQIRRPVFSSPSAPLRYTLRL